MRPSRAEYAELVETFRAQRKISFSEAAALVGVSREVAERAYKRGWAGNERGRSRSDGTPGDPTGRGALLPIRDVLEQEMVTAAGMRRQVLEKMTAEQKATLEAAIRDGAMQRALEGVVSGTFLNVIERQMASMLKMVDAAQPLVDRMIGHIVTQARVKELSVPEIQSILAFITGYGRETAALFRTYADVEKVRVGMAPEKVDEAVDRIDPSKLSPQQAVDDLLTMFGALKSALPEKKTPPSGGVVIDVEPQPQSSSSSRSSSSSSESSSSSDHSSSSSSRSSSSSKSSSSKSESDHSSSSRSSSSGPLKIPKF